MVSRVLTVAALCIIAAIICKLMERYNKEYTIFISIAVCCGVMISVFTAVAPVIELLETLLSGSGVSDSSIVLLFKAVGVCYLSQFAYDICKDNGLAALASQAELIGKVTVILIAMPLFESVISIISRLVNM